MSPYTCYPCVWAIHLRKETNERKRTPHSRRELRGALRSSVGKGVGRQHIPVLRPTRGPYRAPQNSGPDPRRPPVLGELLRGKTNPTLFTINVPWISSLSMVY